MILKETATAAVSQHALSGQGLHIVFPFYNHVIIISLLHIKVDICSWCCIDPLLFWPVSLRYPRGMKINESCKYKNPNDSFEGTYLPKASKWEQPTRVSLKLINLSNDAWFCFKIGWRGWYLTGRLFVSRLASVQLAVLYEISFRIDCPEGFAYHNSRHFLMSEIGFAFTYAAVHFLTVFYIDLFLQE